METFDERRIATIMFVDMCGYTAFLGDEDPEEVARALEQFKRIAGEIVEAYGGIVNQFVGDEIVCLFGVRQSYEDDACRAVTAALMLHERAREMGPLGTRRDRPCVLHSGIETGLVLARVRDFRAGVYDVVGEPVNLAARLRSQASRDEILIGPRTLALTAPFFVIEPQPAFVPRGMTTAISPARVVGLSAAQRPFDAALRRGLTDYVGREVELTRIVQVARAVEQGHGCCLSASGPPGMGKTRLFFEARKRLRSVLSRIPHVLVGRCAAYGRAEPYQPFVDALRKLLDELGDDEQTPSVAQLLHYGADLSVHLPVFAYLLSSETERYPTPIELVGERLRDAIVQALSALLAVLARDQLVVVMLEDWHTADEASDAALRQLVTRFARRPVLFIINFRSTELSHEALPSENVHIDLLPLDRKRTSEIAAAMLETRRVQEDLALYIHERTLGNPFFVEEVCRALVETGAIARRGDALLLTCPVEQLKTPDSVQAMVRARIDRLQAPEKELLRLASVLGTEFSPELLWVLAEASARLPGETGKLASRLPGRLSELEAHGLIYSARQGEHARYRFKHAITCEVAYADLPLEERRAHHDRIGRAIEQRHQGALAPWYDVLAYHFAASPSTEKAVLFGELAGDRALRAYSLEQAIRSFRTAIDCIDSSTHEPTSQGSGRQLSRLEEPTPGAQTKQKKRVQLSLKWAACCVFNPALEQVAVLEVSLRWAREAGDTRSVVRCLCWMAWLSHVVGEQQRALSLNEQALAAADALHDDALVAQIHANIGLSYAMASRYDEALTALSTSISRRELANANGSAGTTPMLAGGGYGYTLAYLGMIAGERGDFADAYALLEKGLSIVEATGRLALIGAVLVLRAMVESWQRDWAACARTAELSRRLAERVNGGYLRAMSDTLSGAARAIAESDPAERTRGLESLRSSVDWLDMRQILLSMSWNEAWLAEALLLAARYTEAEQHARRALTRVPRWDALGEAAARRVLAVVAAVRDGNLVEAERELSAAESCAHQKQSRRELLLVARTRAALQVQAGIAGAARELERCQQELSELGVRIDHALV